MVWKEITTRQPKGRVWFGGLLLTWQAGDTYYVRCLHNMGPLPKRISINAFCHRHCCSIFFSLCHRNLKTGQMLQRIVLRDGFLNSACLRAYSYCVSRIILPLSIPNAWDRLSNPYVFLCVCVGEQGVLFVLLQHQLLCSLEEVGRQHREKDQEIMEEEKKRTALLSLVAVNPVNGKSIPVTRLYPPKAWSGR